MQATASPTIHAPPGTTAYLSGLVARAVASHPDLPIEPIILQSLLLCLIAQPRLPLGSVKPDRYTGPGVHLILRTKEEDVGVVVNLVALTLQHILGVSTHKHKIAQKAHLPSTPLRLKAQRPTPHVSTQGDRPDALLRSLFFRRPPHTSFSSNRSGTPRPRGGNSIDATPRSGSIPLAGQPKSPLVTVGHAPQRSASFPPPSTDGEDEDDYFDASSLASSRRPLLGGRTPASTMRSRGSRGRPNAQRLKTDPLPLSSLFTPPGEELEDLRQPTPSSVNTIRAQQSAAASERTNESGGTASALPKAVVVSGLEHATTPSQRALMRVLTERRLVFDRYDDEDAGSSGRDPDMEDGVWNLPDGFIMVYVCKLDPHERPAILNGLVDRFSMSADVSLQPAVRQSYLAYRAAHTPTPRGTPMVSPLALPHNGHAYFASQTPVHQSPARRTTPLPTPAPPAPPALPASELAYLRTLARPHPVAAPIFYPSVHANIKFPLPASNQQRAPPYAGLHPSLDMYILDLFSATRHHPALDGTLLTMRAHADAEALARAFRVLNGDTIGAALVYHEARMGDRETAAESLDSSSWVDGDSAAWRSADSLAQPKENGKVEKGSEESASALGNGMHGVRLRVDNEDGFRSFSGGFGEYLDGNEAELSPAEALDAAIKRAWPEVWDVSEEDVARIFPRVVSHRLRVRDGPDDEILGSVMWPAIPVEGGAGKEVANGVKLGWERKSVKEILVRVLADV
ncbi:hypothetical protein L226DRAFT_551309 [Lentinus tigrinus ALCF2SS1-7]|uniref:Uncharacterized protein n=1 Tax=Lentinus tigrinus ALCF2SS1-6 TaxID=1328759 RepID=A0A5C2S261_9APHY|nr:hypothetical protein L227DRAFT_530120 [Lentinus tigrinus ALCF2SS1-6]RPD78719.1 hypothetical protein L226DRAFT_551309 [Lentinus tigrinus ALCF2SS1-7]